MRKTFASAFIILILISALEARITKELARQIYDASPNDMISCIVVMKTRYSYGEMRSEPFKSRIRTYLKYKEGITT